MSSPFRGTTICAVRRNGQTAIAGDGQVTMGEKVVFKSTARKVRRLYDGKVVVGNVDRIEDLLYSQTYPNYVPLETTRGIRDLDFDRRDTSDWSSWGSYTRKPRVCTPEGCF